MHTPTTRFASNAHGYPHVPACSCGWEFGRGYASADAAMILAEDHASR